MKIAYISKRVALFYISFVSHPLHFWAKLVEYRRLLLTLGCPLQLYPNTTRKKERRLRRSHVLFRTECNVDTVGKLYNNFIPENLHLSDLHIWLTNLLLFIFRQENRSLEDIFTWEGVTVNSFRFH